MPPSVFILGLGFLGQALRAALIQQAWPVQGSRRHGQEGDAGVLALDVDAAEQAPSTHQALLAADALVCLLPPSGSVAYAANVMRLVTLMHTQGRLTQVVMASSTSVYGNAVRTCTEATPHRRGDGFGSGHCGP